MTCTLDMHNVTPYACTYVFLQSFDRVLGYITLLLQVTHGLLPGLSDTHFTLLSCSLGHFYQALSQFFGHSERIHYGQKYILHCRMHF